MLAIYLNDHFAGATSGAALAKRVARNHHADEFGSRLTAVAREIKRDRTALRQIMRVLGVRPARYKIVAAWLAEKFGRLKPNGGLVRRTRLSALLELEALCLGVQGKAAGWRTLLAVHDQYPRLDEQALRGLLARAHHQFDELENMRARTATALGS
ncbi:hypothetical protein GCM10011581_21750 [Saccharopolyspora subtropica]|uniref:Uncharacterized protein n=2 Tax=Saccharopolyspora thermophila TaxID=89367 RepID=A0A917JU21_9PSEU|nr:hypothetical protein GCM10011581_21750 [Saccharopolyspora subtropica]